MTPDMMYLLGFQRCDQIADTYFLDCGPVRLQVHVPSINKLTIEKLQSLVWVARSIASEK